MKSGFHLLQKLCLSLFVINAFEVQARVMYESMFTSSNKAGRKLLNLRGGESSVKLDDLKSVPISETIAGTVNAQAFENSLTKSVLIIYTGGTMGMRPDKHGSLAVAPGYLTECIKELPEMSRPEMPRYDIKEYTPLMDSSMMGPSDWAKIASDISDNYLKYDGFVVIMGTDTMAYASSALSFMLENLGKPVIFTGSQIPFCEVYNDARRNLIVSIIFATQCDFPEVCIFFNDRLLRANRSVKINSSGLSAFDSPNYPPLATLGTRIHSNNDLALPQPRGPFRAHKVLEAKVLVLRLVPGFDDECIQATVRHSTSLKAIVLEMYGTGNGPSNKGPLLDAIKEAREKGILVVAISQCLRGGVSLDMYSMGREFKACGVISGGDLTAEACTTKLAYLFGRVDDPEVVGRLLTSNLRGEVSLPQSSGRKYFDDGNDMTYISRL